MASSTIILAIESSCDDTSAAVIRDGEIRSNLIANQKVHQSYGGVVPELASREHHKNILPVVHQALQEANVKPSDLSAIAFTKGPGLLGSLLVGCSFAKGLAYSLDKPLIGVNHMEAHVLAHLIDRPRPTFPFLCLTVSGGHTQIVLVSSSSDLAVIGTTIDDAAGEAFDKIGKHIGLDYPAGPIIDRLAQRGDPKFRFTRPKIDGLNFSFSGLKTAVLYFLRDQLRSDPNFITTNLNDICASVQKTIVDILLNRLEEAAEEYNIKTVGIAGGVSANSYLRSAFAEREQTRGWSTFIPDFQYCTDNAGMIAMAAYVKYEAGQFEDLSTTPNPRMKMQVRRDS
ncbi:MAG: tRNA (adenosine(37)-N6)-threonylcarbamoyltransferase complex transferase subunit TsaD [Bacteroidota bacterium]